MAQEDQTTRQKESWKGAELGRAAAAAANNTITTVTAAAAAAAHAQRGHASNLQHRTATRHGSKSETGRPSGENRARDKRPADMDAGATSKIRRRPASLASDLICDQAKETKAAPDCDRGGRIGGASASAGAAREMEVGSLQGSVGPPCRRALPGTDRSGFRRERHRKGVSKADDRGRGQLRWRRPGSERHTRASRADFRWPSGAEQNRIEQMRA